MIERISIESGTAMRTLLRAIASSIILTVSAAGSAANAPDACAKSVYQQFDFWIGNWNVYLPNGKLAGTNRIDRIAKGCALHENWSGTGGVLGESLNMYDETDKLWHQSWVDSSGSRLDLAGKLVNKQMILQGEAKDDKSPSGVTTQKITWTPQADGSVRQLWESSQDHGKTWTVAFDGKYVRK